LYHGLAVLNYKMIRVRPDETPEDIPNLRQQWTIVDRWLIVDFWKTEAGRKRAKETWKWT